MSSLKIKVSFFYFCPSQFAYSIAVSLLLQIILNVLLHSNGQLSARKFIQKHYLARWNEGPSNRQNNRIEKVQQRVRNTYYVINTTVCYKNVTLETKSLTSVLS